jgi:hypothetical protein
MNIELKVSSNYGFEHSWTLVVEARKRSSSFYLGQDVKFCNRVLGMSPRQVINETKIKDLRTQENLNSLAKWIAKQIGVNGNNHSKFNAWDFCAE